MTTPTNSAGTAEQTPDQHRIASADGIRGLACLIVLLVHSCALIMPATFPFLVGTGKIGVWLFFVLSAYLLTLNLLHTGISNVTLLSYAMSRFFRIYPLFLLAVLVAYGTKSIGINSYHDAIQALSLRQGFGHLWTIAVEFKFYLVLPLMVWCGGQLEQRYGLKGVIIAAALAVVGHQLLFPYSQLQEGSVDTVWYLPAFVFGSVGAFINVGYQTQRPHERAGLLCGITVLALVLLSTPFMRYFLFQQTPSRDLLNKYLFFSLLWAAFVVTQHRYPNALSRLLSRDWISQIGKWSYSIYLFHFFIAIKMGEHFPGQPGMVMVAMLCSVVVGYLSYTLFEKPLLQLRGTLLNWTRIRIANA